jgi:hypothetical protein
MLTILTQSSLGSILKLLPLPFVSFDNSAWTSFADSCPDLEISIEENKFHSSFSLEDVPLCLLIDDPGRP